MSLKFTKMKMLQSGLMFRSQRPVYTKALRCNVPVLLSITEYLLLSVPTKREEPKSTAVHSVCTQSFGKYNYSPSPRL